MLFSKSSGYAIRAILFLTSQSEERGPVQLDEIAEAINVPRYFLGKVMNRLVKGNIVESIKGHHGGFFINEATLKLPLNQLTELMGEKDATEDCMLHLGKCSAENPCPIHNQIAPLRAQWHQMLSSITIGDISGKDRVV
jgi:Rrf2 family protein